MTRILIITSEFPPGPGGIGTHAFQLASSLFRAGWLVQVVSPQDYAEEEEVLAFNTQQPFKVETLPSHQFKLLQNIKRASVINRNIRDFKPDLVVASGGRAIWLSAFLLALRKIPWVLVGHGTEFGQKSGLGAWLTRFAGNQADLVICVSQYTQKALKDLGIVGPPSFVVHNGADHTCYSPLPKLDAAAFRKRQGVGDKFVLLTVGSVSKRKGQEVVIRALSEIKDEHPNIEYWMVGLPGQQAELEIIADDLGVAENIRFLGCVSNESLLELYNACDLFVMTSRQLEDGDFEGYGIAVIEAALCGKPAVVSDNSGLAEAVQDGITGLLVPQNDPQKTAAAVLSLMEDLEMLKKLGAQAYENARGNQTWEQVGHQYVDLLDGVLQVSGLDKQ